MGIRKRQILSGVVPPLVVSSGGWLKMDGVNDNATFGDSSFYNVGGSDFTIAVRAVVFRLGSGAGSRLLIFLRKGSLSNPGTKYYSVGTCDGGNINIGFRLSNGGSTHSKSFGVNLSSFNIENNLGKELNIIYRRINQDDTLTATLNVNNYHVFINGIKYSVTQIAETGTISSDPFDNPYESGLNGYSASNLCQLYYNKYLFYDKALSDTECQNLNFESPFENGLKSALYFNSLSGTTVKDYSSVANNATLNNYTNSEVGVPDPATNVVWCSDVVPFHQNEMKTFIAPQNLTTAKFRRGFTDVMSFTLVHKRGGVTLNTYSDIFSGGNQANIAISMQQLDTLEITPTSSGSYLGALEIFY